MSDYTPDVIRDVLDFREVTIYETSNLYPIGTKVLETFYPYKVSGSTILSTTTTVPAGTGVSGTVGYYGLTFTGNRTLLINDPIPEIFNFPGEDQVQAVMTLPSLQVINGELNINFTNDIFDALVQNVKTLQIGQMNILGQQTNQRVNEKSFCLLASSFAQDADTEDSNFGTTQWDFRIYPDTIINERDKGKEQELTARLYSVIPNICNKYPWGVTFDPAVEGYNKNRFIRGNSQYKPVMVSYLGNGSVRAFPFDSRYPAESAAKIAGIWLNGTEISTGSTKSTSGVVLNSAPNTGDVLVVLYETLK